MIGLAKKRDLRGRKIKWYREKQGKSLIKKNEDLVPISTWELKVGSKNAHNPTSFRPSCFIADKELCAWV